MPITCCCNNRCFLCHWHWNLLWNILLECESVTAKKKHEGVDRRIPVHRDTTKNDQCITVQIDDPPSPIQQRSYTSQLQSNGDSFFGSLCHDLLPDTDNVLCLPINQSVENLPSRIFSILRVASALLVSLLAYKIVFVIQDTPSLSVMSSAIRDFLLKKKDENCDLDDKRNWDTLDEEKNSPAFSMNCMIV